MTRTISEIRQSMKETRREMHAKGVKRISCFNGGLSGEVYSLNARMFALETELKDAERAEQQYSQASELDADEYDSEFRRGHALLHWKPKQ